MSDIPHAASSSCLEYELPQRQMDSHHKEGPTTRSITPNVDQCRLLIDPLTIGIHLDHEKKKQLYSGLRVDGSTNPKMSFI